MNKVENYFGRIAKEFDLHYKEEETFIDKIINKVFREKTLQRRMKYTIDEIKNDAKNKTVLDIGCGPGHFSVALAKSGTESVTGIDFAENKVLWKIHQTIKAAAGVTKPVAEIIQVGTSAMEKIVERI